MKKAIVISLLLAGMTFVSCEREDILSLDDNKLFMQAESDAISEVVLQAIDDMIDKEIDKLERMKFNVTGLKSAQVESCDPVITIETPDDARFPKKITLDYGSGCTDADGNFRAGKVMLELTGPHWEKNSTRTAVLVDYYFNDLKVEGEREVVNKGTNDDGFYVFKIEHALKFTLAESGELVSDRVWKRERLHDRGEDLKSNQDDEIWITGSSKVERNGKKLIKEITTPLNRILSCQHFQSGVITTFIDDEKVAEFDYGNGECDNIATWTNLRNNSTKTITLKNHVHHFSVRK